MQSQISSSEGARNRDALFLDLALRKWPRRNNHGPIALAHAAAAGHQRVQILNIRIGMKRNGSDVIDAFARLLIQRFNIAKGVREAQSWHANLIGSEAVKHESIVGVRAVSDIDLAHIGR